MAVVVGTRPEAIKLAPVVHVARHEAVDPVVFSTGQHLEMAQEALSMFGVVPDRQLRIGQPANGPTGLLAAGVAELGAEIGVGEFTGCWCRAIPPRPRGSLGRDGPQRAGRSPGGRASFKDVNHPFPEEHHRKAITAVARLHLAPTPEAQAHLLHEGVAAVDAPVVGNTVIDALLVDA